MGPDTTWAVKSEAIKERSLARVCFYSSADVMNKFSGHEKGVAQCRRDERACCFRRILETSLSLNFPRRLKIKINKKFCRPNDDGVSLALPSIETTKRSINQPTPQLSACVLFTLLFRTHSRTGWVLSLTLIFPPLPPRVSRDMREQGTRNSFAGEFCGWKKGVAREEPCNGLISLAGVQLCCKNVTSDTANDPSVGRTFN